MGRCRWSTAMRSSSAGRPLRKTRCSRLAEGADWFGVVVEVDFSPRSLTIEQARALFRSPPLPMVALVFHMPEARLALARRGARALCGPVPEPGGAGSPPAVQGPPPGDRGLAVDPPTGGRGSRWRWTKHGRRRARTPRPEPTALVFDTVATLQGTRKFGGTGITLGLDRRQGAHGRARSRRSGPAGGRHPARERGRGPRRPSGHTASTSARAWRRPPAGGMRPRSRR